MRLLRCKKAGSARTYTFSLTTFDPKNIPSYAILSHRWGDDEDEVTFRDIERDTATKRAGGYKKLTFCAQQAERDGLMYFWIDTCCIDKTSSSELSEAINSMYRWYRNATRCYVYLPDVSAKQEREQAWEEAFQKSEWFKRGWTLQELIAPNVVEFFSNEGTKLGNKKSLLAQIQRATSISTEVLQGKPLAEVSEQERFSWAIRRQTTLEEDAVYCLLGIFDVHMPLIYGEGRQKALVRLQREIQLLYRPNLYINKEAAWVVPFERNARFTGREAQLAELEEKLTANVAVRKIAVIGLGGVGKTQLVLELLYRYKEQHKGCSIMWIKAISKESIEQGYLTVAQQLNIAGCEDPKVDVKKRVQDYLSSDAIGPWLLVYDGADELDLWTTIWTSSGDIEGEYSLYTSSHRSERLIDCLPQSRHGCIIFITRNKKAAITLAPGSIVTVPAMSEAAAAQLLTSWLANTNLTEDTQNTSKLLAALSYLPLAISQAAAYINANDITLADYVSLLEEKEEAVIELLSEDFKGYGHYQNINNTIASTWLMSFEQIRRSSPLAAEYLSFMACIDFRGIPQSLLPRGPSRKEEIDAIGILTAYSFVSRQLTNTLLELHPLVHLITRNWLRQERTLHEWTEKAIDRIEEVLPDQAHEHENRAVWRTYLPHAQHVLASDLINHDRKQSIELLWKYRQCLDSDAEREPVRFHHLRDSEFRLLTLESGGKETPIVGRIRTYKLQSAPTYYALSYVWGHEPKIHSIKIDGRVTDIQPNLFHALQRMRPLNGQISLWIDTICINQNNISERSMQIKQMASIYRKATVVFIWLGEADLTSQSAMDLAMRVTSSKFDWSGQWWRRSEFLALNQLLMRPWFGRVWVLQEIACSTEAAICCGDSQIHKDQFTAAVEIIQDKLSYVSMTSDDTAATEISAVLAGLQNSPAIRLLYVINNAFRASVNGDTHYPTLSLETLVDLSTFCETSDKRDSVYALLNLANDVTPASQQDQPGVITPDYRKAVLDVYADFIMHCCLRSRSLDIICRPWAPVLSSVSGSNEDIESVSAPCKYPSWIVSKDKLPFGNPSRQSLQRLHGDSIVGTSRKRKYSAHFGSHPCASVSKRWKGSCDGSLHVKGLVIGKVAQRSTRLASAIITKDCLKLLGVVKRTSHSGFIDIPDAIWRTLCADRSRTGDVAPRSYRLAMQHLLEVSLESTEAENSINLLDHMQDIDVEELLYTDVADYIKEFLAVVQGTIWNRRTFRSEETTYANQPLVGLIPQHAGRDDLICILYGCSVPVVIRKTLAPNNSFECTLIGEAYVYGIMEGELLRSAESNLSQFKEVEFIIR